jgi:hypothetical protein
MIPTNRFRPTPHTRVRAHTAHRLVRTLAAIVAVGCAGLAQAQTVPNPTIVGPIPGTAPGDPLSPVLEETYPFFSTYVDLAAAGWVEEEFYVSGEANGYDTDGHLVGTDVPYVTRIIVRRPTAARDFNGVVLMEWQNVSAGFDLDALWAPEQLIREGYAWIGVSAQRVGNSQLAAWSPTRYGSFDVTGGGVYPNDELSYDIFAQAAKAVRSPQGVDPMGGLPFDTLLAIGASQSAGRMTVFYDVVLPQIENVFDGYAQIVGSAPTRVGPEPVFQILSETDVRTPNMRADTDQFRRWEVAGAAHSGLDGQIYRAPILERDLGGATQYNCVQPPFSRVHLTYVIAAAYGHLARWVRDGTPPPTAPPLLFDADGNKERNALGIALGGIRLSQVEVPIALNSGSNLPADLSSFFCVLFGTYQPFDDATLEALYPNHGQYVSEVKQVDQRNVKDGYLLRGDARVSGGEAAHSDVGK